MQGIYQGFEIMTHDAAWTVALDLAQDKRGNSSTKDALFLIMQSSSAGIAKE